MLFLLIILIASIQIEAQSYIAPGFYDDDLPLITFGSYSGATNAAFYRGTAKVFSVDGNGITFDFQGLGFAVYGLKYSTGSNVSVCVDDVCNIISLYSAVSTYGEMFRYEYGAAGSRHVTVKRAPGGGTGWFYFDALYIIPPPEATPQAPVINVTVELTQEPEAPLYRSEFTVTDSLSNEQAVAFDYQFSAGDILIALLIIPLIILSISQLIVGALWKS